MLQYKFNRIAKTIILLSTLLSGIVGCSMGSGSSENNQLTAIKPLNSSAVNVYFEQITPIMSAGIDKPYALRIYNTSDDTYQLTELSAIDPVSNSNNPTLADSDLSACHIIKANSTCTIYFTPHIDKDFLFSAKLTNKHQQTQIGQFIRFSKQIISDNGLDLDNDLKELAVGDTAAHFAVPLLLTDDFDQIKVSNGKLTCLELHNNQIKLVSNKYRSGMTCTYQVDDNNNDHELTTTIEGYRNGKKVAQKNYTTAIVRGKNGNLLISTPQPLELDSKTKAGKFSFLLYNNGLSLVKDINIEITKKFTINPELKIDLSNHKECTSLKPGELCTIEVLASGVVTNGIVNLVVNYQTDNDGKSEQYSADLSTFVLKEGTGPTLNISYIEKVTHLDGSSDKNTVDLKITNTGDLDLTKIKYTLDNNSFFNIEKYQDNELAACPTTGVFNLPHGTACGIKISYTNDGDTNDITDGQLMLGFYGEYQMPNNYRLTYIKSEKINLSEYEWDKIDVSINDKLEAVIGNKFTTNLKFKSNVNSTIHIYEMSIVSDENSPGKVIANGEKFCEDAVNHDLLFDPIPESGVCEIPITLKDPVLTNRSSVGLGKLNVDIKAYDTRNHKNTYRVKTTIPYEIKELDLTLDEAKKLGIKLDPNGVLTEFKLAADQTTVIIPYRINGFPVKKIGHSLFSSKEITRVHIPRTVQEIGNLAFNNTDLNQGVFIPGNVEKIGDSAFQNSMLTSVAIAEGVKMIDSYAFEHNNITSLKLPNSVTNVIPGAFWSNQLTDLTISNKLATIADHVFADNKLTTIIIPNGVKTIKRYAFSGSRLLKKIIIGSSIHKIEDLAFTNASNTKLSELESVIICKQKNDPNNPLTLGKDSFYGFSLDKITYDPNHQDCEKTKS